MLNISLSTNKILKHVSFIAIIFIAIVSLVGCSDDDDAPEGTQNLPSLVKDTTNGPVEGFEDSYNTLAWLGIKYAKAPEGELRWKAPQDPDPWQEIKRADSFSDACVQYGTALNWIDYSLYGKPQGSEDCLSLNIWRPNTTEESLPVFVFIHGGANFIGSSSLGVYNGAHLSSEANMIVVTINYRLGLLGWFYHPAIATGDSLDDSGNYGTLDIIKSLEWVRDNIAFFGGDPANVTIAGQSAGAMNVLSLLASPNASGLFHKAVIHSGFLISSPMETAQNWSLNVIRRLLIQEGRASDNAEADAIIEEEGAQLGEYLRGLPAEKIYDPSVAKSSGGTSDNDIKTILSTFGIYEDGTVIGGDVSKKIESGDYNHVPVIIGCTSSEIKMFMMMMLLKPEKMYKLISEYDPKTSTQKVNDIIGAIAAFKYREIASAGQAVFYKYGVNFTADLLANHGDTVYAYKFVWENGTGPFKFLLGGSHAEDVPFLFGNFLPHGDSLIGLMWSDTNKLEREIISEEMMTYWGNFAWSGDPNNDSSPTNWQRYNDGKKRLVIGQINPKMIEEETSTEDLECPTCTIDDLLLELEE